MDTISASDPVRVAPDTFVFPSHHPLPGLGVLPVNAFLIRARQPILVDTGTMATSADFVVRLEGLLDPSELRWVYLTHTDPDHVGAIERVLEAAPNARVVTTYLGMGKMGLHRPLPEDRAYFLNPGQELDLGDRKLRALRPPVYDAPETTALFDPKTRAFFTADCFGALLRAPVESAADLAVDELREGMVTWASVDAPWLEHIDADVFDAAIRVVTSAGPDYVLCAHLPPAQGLTDRLADCLRSARGVRPFVGPDQAAFEAMTQAAG